LINTETTQQADTITATLDKLLADTAALTAIMVELHTRQAAIQARLAEVLRQQLHPRG